MEQANRLRQPLFVFFFLNPGFPEAGLRHYVFMLQGLLETRRRLEERGIPLILRVGDPPEELSKAAAGASLVVTDRGYLKVHREWRSRAAGMLSCPLFEIESDSIVPVETAYPKEAWSAAVLRPRILRLLFAYLVPLETRGLKYPAAYHGDGGPDITDSYAAALSLAADPAVPPVEDLRGGTAEGLRRLEIFVEEKLDRFDLDRNNPALQGVSVLSPYLHFGQISPLTAALAAAENPSPGSEGFLEELIVRRELAMNYTFYNRDYDSFSGLPVWARKTLAAHQRDPREYVYSREDLETGRTHDRYWNAAQKELTETGRIHGYMRMYWGKKILQWSSSPEEAFKTALFFNNRWALDGRDPNSFAGVAWCFGKHDRPWKERDIFGTVRYMNAQGLKRKFPMEDYVHRTEEL